MGDLFYWVVDQILTGLQDFAYFLYESILMGCVALLDLIPIPSWADPSALLAAIPNEAWFFSDFAQIGAGTAIIASAIGIRFVIRRLPVVG